MSQECVGAVCVFLVKEKLNIFYESDSKIKCPSGKESNLGFKT